MANKTCETHNKKIENLGGLNLKCRECVIEQIQEAIKKIKELNKKGEITNE